MAIEACPEEMVYYSKKAEIFFEMDLFEQCDQACNEALNCAESGNYDK